MSTDFRSKGAIDHVLKICEESQRNIATDPNYKVIAKKLVSDNIMKSFLQWLKSRNDEEGIILLEEKPKFILKFIYTLVMKRELVKSPSRTRKLQNGYLESTGKEIIVHMISNRAWGKDDLMNLYIISNTKRAFKWAIFAVMFNQLPAEFQTWWEKYQNVSVFQIIIIVINITLLFEICETVCDQTFSSS